MLLERKIVLSKSPISVLLFIVDKDASIKKKGRYDDNNYFRPVVNWRDLNSKSIPNSYPLPLVVEL